MATKKDKKETDGYSDGEYPLFGRPISIDGDNKIDFVCSTPMRPGMRDLIHTTKEVEIRSHKRQLAKLMERMSKSNKQSKKTDGGR